MYKNDYPLHARGGTELHPRRGDTSDRPAAAASALGSSA